MPDDTLRTRILVIDGDEGIRSSMQNLLSKWSFDVTPHPGDPSVLSLIARKGFDVVVCEMKMCPVTGLEVLARVKESKPSIPVIMISAWPSAKDAVEALKGGAVDYVPWPPNDDELLRIVREAVQKARLEKTEEKTVPSCLDPNRELIGESVAMSSIGKLIESVAPTPSNVLITGESGTGKELVARAIHARSNRASNPFVTVNCGAIPETLIESELFGHSKGAFTGAVTDKQGLFEAANDGTLFLDEIGDLPLLMQVKLLRAIQERRVKPVGATKEIDVDVRIVAATNRNPEDDVKEGRFRKDLFYRLNVIEIRMPPLRERPEDIPLLVRHFLGNYARKLGREARRMAPAATEALMRYPFPGNVRELENIVERAVALAPGEEIGPDSLPREVGGLDAMKSSNGDIVELLWQLELAGGDLDRLARRLGAPVSELERVIQVAKPKGIGIILPLPAPDEAPPPDTAEPR